MVLKIFLKTVEFYILQAKKFFKAGFFYFCSTHVSSLMTSP